MCIPPEDLNQGPPYVVFVGRSMPTSGMAIEVAAYEAVTRLRFIVPAASEGNTIISLAAQLLE